MDTVDRIRAVHRPVNETGERWSGQRCRSCGDVFEPLSLGGSTVYGCDTLRAVLLAEYEAARGPKSLIVPSPGTRIT